MSTNKEKQEIILKEQQSFSHRNIFILSYKKVN